MIQGPVLKKILSPLVILSLEKTMVTMVINELKSISRLKIFRETGPRTIMKRSNTGVSHSSWTTSKKEAVENILMNRCDDADLTL